MKRLLLILPVLALSGCQVLAPQIDKAADGAAKAIKFYCDNITDASIRLQLREKVNAKAAPNSIAVTCAGGGQVLKTGE